MQIIKIMGLPIVNRDQVSPSPLSFQSKQCLNNSEERAFQKHCGKMEKCWSPRFSPFPTVFSTLLPENSTI